MDEYDHGLSVTDISLVIGLLIFPQHLSDLGQGAKKLSALSKLLHKAVYKYSHANVLKLL